MDTSLNFLITNGLTVTLLAGGVWLLTRIWKNPYAAHALWVLVLVKFVTPPLWTIGLPVSTSPSGSPKAVSERQDGGDRASRTVSPQSLLATVTANAIPPDGTSAGPSSIAPESPIESAPTLSSACPGAAEEPNHSIAASAATDGRIAESAAAVAATPAGHHTSTIPWRPIAFVVWLLGSVIFGCVVLRRCVPFGRLLREADAASADILARVTALRRRMNLQTVVEVRVSRQDVPPLLWGIGRPVTIVLPNRLLTEVDQHELDAILSHELMHLRRGDHWVRLLEVAAGMVFWWHPVFWGTRRVLSYAEEQCCDADVLGLAPDSATSYASALLKSVEVLHGCRRAPLSLSSAFIRRPQLTRRIERILAEPAARRLSVAGRLALLVALLSLPVSVAAQAPTEGEAAESNTRRRPPSTESAERQHVAPAAPAQESSTTTPSTADAPSPRPRPYGELGFPEGQFGPHWELVRLATHPPVQQELGLTAEQVRALAPVSASLILNSGDWSSGRENRELLKEEYDRTLEVLTPEQKVRLDQIILQRRGMTALFQPDIVEQLGLDDDQVQSLRGYWKEHLERAEQGWKGTEGRDSYYRVWAKALNTLTNEQRQRFASMTGLLVVKRPTAPRQTPRTDVAAPTGRTLLPSFVNEALYWFPEDTETLLVGRDFVAAEVADWQTRMAGERDMMFANFARFMALGPLGTMKSAAAESLRDRKVRWAVMGGRNYDIVSAFGGLRCEGCSVIQFEQPLAGLIVEENRIQDGSLLGRLREEARDIWRISGHEVFVFPPNLDDREPVFKQKPWEGIFLTLVSPDTLLLATSDVYLMQTLRRRESDATQRALPFSLPEWRRVDVQSAAWGLRHVPASAAEATLAGLAWTTSDSGDPLLRVTYLAREGRDYQPTARELWKELPDDQIVTEGQVTTVTVAAGESDPLPLSLFFLTNTLAEAQ